MAAASPSVCFPIYINSRGGYCGGVKRCVERSEGKSGVLLMSVRVGRTRV